MTDRSNHETFRSTHVCVKLTGSVLLKEGFDWKEKRWRNHKWENGQTDSGELKKFKKDEDWNAGYSSEAEVASREEPPEKSGLFLLELAGCGEGTPFEFTH